MRKLVHELNELCAREMHVLNERLSERCVFVLRCLLVVLFVYSTFRLPYINRKQPTITIIRLSQLLGRIGKIG